MTEAEILRFDDIVCENKAEKNIYLKENSIMVFPLNKQFVLFPPQIVPMPSASISVTVKLLRLETNRIA